MERSGHVWALLLAAGEGDRIRPLTRAADGKTVPKQFYCLNGRKSLLRTTIDRVSDLVQPGRVVTIVAAHHRQWWSRELSDFPPENVVVQPLNRGTAAGILLPAVWILHRDPDATIVVLPSDHHVDEERVIGQAIADAVEAVEADADRVVLLGMPPRDADREYGWIVPSGPNGGVERVTAFVEKPDRERARELKTRGGLLNSLILVAKGRALLRLYVRAAPGLLGEFVSWRDESDLRWPELESIYATLPSRDFSRDVLEECCDYLSVKRVSECGWSDVGTPERLRRVDGRGAETAPIGVPRAAAMSEA